MPWPTPCALDRPRTPETMEKCAAFRLRNAGQTTVPLYLGEVAEQATDQMWYTPVARDHMPAHTEEYIASTKELGHGMGNLNDQVSGLWKTPRVARGGYTRDKGDPDQERLTLEGEAAMWSTPKSSEGFSGADFAKADRSNTGAGLATEAALWPTPQSRDHKGADQETVDRGNACPLNEVAVTWATPSSSDSTGTTGGGQVRSLRTDAGTWRTPNLTDANGGVRLGEGQLQLAQQTTQWNTPRASDGEKGGPNQSFTDGEGQPLPAQAAQWQTPSVAMTEGGQTSRSGDRRDELLLPSQAKDLSMRQDQENSTDGAPSSHAGRSLNPLFVELLMSWPPGWTLLLSTVSTAFVCSEMAFTLWKARMRSELLRLGSPPAPPLAKAPKPPEPEQFGLFN
jgi:hypothetical protein